MNDNIFAQFKTAMKNADKGEPLSYKNIEPVFEMEESDYFVHCIRCNKWIDIRIEKTVKINKLYGQPVRDHVCDDCAALLKNFESDI